jgi:hypothetical protein
MITATTIERLKNVFNDPQRTMLECQNCQCIFTPEDEWNTCPECLFNHCFDCDTCWDSSDDDKCPCCNPKEEEPCDYGWKLRTVPGTSLTYWA